MKNFKKQFEDLDESEPGKIKIWKAMKHPMIVTECCLKIMISVSDETFEMFHQTQKHRKNFFQKKRGKINLNKFYF
jgi:hypothetical protein